MNRFCTKCHRPWIASADIIGANYICPDCDQRNMRAKYGKSASIYPRNVTVMLLGGQAI